MRRYDGIAIAMSKDSPGIGEKSELEPKANNTEEEAAEHISGNEPVLSKEEELLSQLNSSATSPEWKKRSGDLLDDLKQKRQKHHMNSTEMYANLNMSKSIADRIDIQKQERSGSSGKRSRVSFDSETGPEGKEVSGDDSVSKRRKVFHAYNNIELKMLGPLKLPDYVEGFKYDNEHSLEIIELNKQLIEINKKLRAEGAIDNCLVDDSHSPSPPPIYNEIGIRVNTRVNRLRKKLSHRRQQIICELNHKNPLFLPTLDDKPTKFSRKLYIPVKQYPNYNFVGLIIGPRGHTQKRMERESGARILLRGKGSTRLRKGKQLKDRKNEPFEDEDLHVYIEAEDEMSVESATEMVEKLLVPVNEEVNEHKQSQLRELAVLNSENSTEALNSTNQNNVACYAHDVQRHGMSPTPLNPTNSESVALLPSHDAKHDSAFRLSHDIKPGEVIDKAKLFVGFLPQSVNTEKLVKLFLPFGRICEAVVIVDRRTGLSKGYGFVKYVDPLSAAEALAKMNGFRIDGKIITVRIAGRTPLNANTIIGPRAVRFANQPSNMHSQGVTKAWLNWMLLPQPNAFPLHADSVYRRPHVFTEFSEQYQVVSSLTFGGPVVPFPCYHNVAHSLD